MSTKTTPNGTQRAPGTTAEIHERIRDATAEELAQCLRLLGMYLALYKRNFGELEESCYAGLLGADPQDFGLAELMAAGLDEAGAMLWLVQNEPERAAVPEAPLN